MSETTCANHAIYEGYTYQKLRAKYPGKSIISGKDFKAGTEIYWRFKNQETCGGFTVDEYEQLIKNGSIGENLSKEEVSHNKYDRGPHNPKYTYNDKNSRELTIKLFKKTDGIELRDHDNLYDSEHRLIREGKYEIDLYYPDPNDERKCIFVEVERSNWGPTFDKNNPDKIGILVEKYWKYFHHETKNHKYYMCYINEEAMLACVIPGQYIKASYCSKKVDTKYGIREFTYVDKKYAKIYDLNQFDN